MQASRAKIAELASAALRMAESTRRGQARVFDPVRVGILQIAVEAGPVRPGDIAERLDILPSSVTRQVQALVEAGYVAVTPDPADRRASLIEATESGRLTHAEFTEAGLDVFCGVVAEWSEQDIETLTVLLNRLIDDWVAKGPTQQQRATKRVIGTWFREN